MKVRCRREVRDLHRFFVAWMTGAVARGAAVFARFEGVAAAGFALISPSGVITERTPLIAELEAAHGARKGQGFQIRVRSFRQRHTAGPLWSTLGPPSSSSRGPVASPAGARLDGTEAGVAPWGGHGRSC